MKKALSTLGLLLSGIAGYCQEAPPQGDNSPKPAAATPAPASEIVSQTAVATSLLHPLKNNDRVLPRWFFDINYRTGQLDQTIEMVNLNTSYTQSLADSKYVNPTYSGTKSVGGDAQIGYFLGKNRRFGVGLGFMYVEQTGTMTTSDFRADYRATDSKGNVYRQIIHSNGPIQEDVKITNSNIPLMLKFKHQFGQPNKLRKASQSIASNIGISADIGGVLGLSNTTSHEATGSYSYEAIYKLSPDKHSIVSGFDDGIPPNANTSLLLTEAQFNSTPHVGTAQTYFDQVQSENTAFNVGLNKPLAPNQRSGSTSYSALSAGFIAQLGLSYTLSYNLAFNVRGYYMYQQYKNTNNTSYRPTDQVVTQGGSTYGSYSAMTNGISQSTYSSYGVSAGFRFYFGEKRDVDDDGVIDVKDDCPLVWGNTRSGCPDSDGDGVLDDQDACKDEPGPEYAAGCPDRDHDGFADKNDNCPDEPGEYKGCPLDKIIAKTKPDSTLVGNNGIILPPHLVLETDVLHFDYGKAELDAGSAETLNNAVNLLNKDPRVIIHISGYTDDVGSYSSNLILSVTRAKAAKAYILGKGITEKRIIVSGYGQENPVIANTTPEARAKNRRIELKLLLPLE